MAKLDRLIHQPVRLQIMAALVALDDEAGIAFTSLRDSLELTDGNLSTHLRKLEDAGYLQLEKSFVARKPHTFLRATPKGRRRFQDHAAALGAILRGD